MSKDITLVLPARVNVRQRWDDSRSAQNAAVVQLAKLSGNEWRKIIPVASSINNKVSKEWRFTVCASNRSSVNMQDGHDIKRPLFAAKMCMNEEKAA